MGDGGSGDEMMSVDRKRLDGGRDGGREVLHKEVRVASNSH